MNFNTTLPTQIQNQTLQSAFPADANGSKVAVESLTANTSKQIAIPADAVGVFVYPLVTTAVFFKLDEAWTAVPTGTYVAGGILPPLQASSRKFGVLGADHTLNLICANTGDVIVEFWKES